MNSARWDADASRDDLREYIVEQWLEEHERSYAVMVPKTNAVPLGGLLYLLLAPAEQLGEEVYSEILPDGDSGERRSWEWACPELAADPKKGMGRWLLIRRSTDNPDDLSFYQAYGPEATPIEALVRVCQAWWAIEATFEVAKGMIGM